jgi:two-component SAPR family response regulator
LLGADDALRLEGGEITLDATRVSVDIWSFERWFGQAQSRANPAGSISAMHDALSLYQGPFLSGVELPGVQNARERLRSKYVRGVVLGGETLERGEGWRPACALYERAIDVEPLAEELYVRLIRCYQKIGREAEAMAVYRRCETMLHTLLGQKPGSALRALYEQLRRSV